MIKAADKFSTTGYGYEGEGESRVLVPIPASQKLKHHDAKDQHKQNAARVEAEKRGVGAERIAGGEKVYLTITPEDELCTQARFELATRLVKTAERSSSLLLLATRLVETPPPPPPLSDARTIRTVHTIVRRQLSLNDMYHLLELQHANGMVISFDHACISSGVDHGGLATWLLAGANVAQRRLRARAQSLVMKQLFPKGVPFGLMGDGSNDRSLAEQEAVVLRFLGGDCKPFNAFYDLAELDLKTSDDGRSPDARCITACYASSLSQLDQHEGFIFMSSWKKALIGASFDGASVMLGSQNGVAKKLMELAESMKIVIHAAAHVTQLGNADGFALCEYYLEWRETTQEVFVEYAQSGKKRFGLEEIAHELGDHLLKLSGSHGIRWAAAQARTVKALLHDLPSIAVDLSYRAKTAVGDHFTEMTLSNSFLRKTFFDTFENDAGKRTRWKCTVDSFTESPDGLAAKDRFKIVFSNKTTMSMSKAELVGKLTDEEKSGLAEDLRWQLRKKLIQYRFAAFTAFMLDVHEQLSILSRSYQGNSLVVFDISRHLNTTLAKLTKLKTTPGEL